jgi:hypothetical protein
MVSLTSLWLPVVLSAVGVFMASSIVHMVLRYHHNDFKKLPAQDEVMDALRKFNIPPGDYLMPCASAPAEMRTPEFKEKWARGPLMVATFWQPGPISMGPQLAQWFVFCLVVSLFAAYVTSRTLGPAAEMGNVCQIASTTAFLGYAMSHWSDAIWYKRSKKTVAKATFDGLVYGLITGFVFGWLWPQI